jgi:TP53 regulating kinase and related kinases
MIIAQGAEAIIVKKGNVVLKDRVSKGYRYKELDKKIRKIRTRAEAKLLEKAGLKVNVPKVLKVDEIGKIELEFVKGFKLSNSLDKMGEALMICEKIGEGIGKLHDEGIIHGDLTTSNMIWNGKIYFIDFGLGFFSNNIEDKAVDLHLIKQALEAKHYSKFTGYFGRVIKGYSKSKDAREVLKRLEKVEKRGRYKGQY